MMQHAIHGLFLCTGNSARSQMAEGLLHTYGDNERIHWSYDDPAEVIEDLDLQYQKFKRIRNEISERLRLWGAV